MRYYMCKVVTHNYIYTGRNHQLHPAEIQLFPQAVTASSPCNFEAYLTVQILERKIGGEMG